MPRYDSTSSENFERLLLTVVNDDLSRPWHEYPCLVWDRIIGTTGHGVMQSRGPLIVSRVAYERFKGPIPNRSQIRHYCKVRACFRPCHLYVPNDMTNLEYLQAQLAEIHDDPSRPWSDYRCLIWPRGTMNGYGSLRINGANERAPRVAYSITSGIVLSSDDFICHRCDIYEPDPIVGNFPAYRLCYRPSHLFLGDSAANSRDMAEKGRSAWGERGGHTKLTEEQVHEIRRLHETGMGAWRLGKRFGTSKTAIQYILIGRNWSHLPHQTNQGVSK